MHAVTNSDALSTPFDNEFGVDVAILGAGMAGMYAAYCCSLMGIGCAVVDELAVPGGQCMALYPEKTVYGVPGYVGVKAKDYVLKLSEQCLTTIRHKFFGYRVEKINTTSENKFGIEARSISACNDGDNDIRISAQYIILATGIGEMKPNIPVTIKGVSEVSKSSDFVQFYCLNHALYRGKNVVIAGGGDSAVDFTIDIAPIAKHVTIVHRRENFTCEPHKIVKIQELVNAGKIKLEMNQNILELREFAGKRYVYTDKKEYTPDHIVFCYGFIANPGSIVKDLGIETEKNLIKVSLGNMETSVKNCYAVGDAVTYVNKKKNIIPCFFEADRAVRAIKTKISGG